MSPLLPDDLLARSPEEATRRLAYAFLEDARQAAERLRRADDEEALHDFRVAVRRLRSWIKAWSRPLGKSVRSKDRKALSQLQRSTNSARDAEVALAWLRGLSVEFAPEELFGYAWFQRRFERRHSEAMVRIRERVLEDFERVDRGIGQRLGLMRIEMLLLSGGARESFAQALAERLARNVEDLKRDLDRVASVEDENEVHELRLTTKRLRYLIEALRDRLQGGEAVVRQLKKLQKLLGELNDAFVLGEELALTMESHASSHQGSEDHDPRPGLLALDRANRERRNRDFEVLERDWLGRKPRKKATKKLLDLTKELGASLESQTRPEIEIERKYLLRGAPDGIGDWPVEEIEQGWLPGRTLQERIRHVRRGGEDRYYRTVKLGRGISRIEVEEEASAELFAVLWPLTEGCRVRKRRYREPSPRDGQCWLVDVFVDRELVLSEVELRSEQTEPRVPKELRDWVEREVTDDGEFVNRSLAR